MAQQQTTSINPRSQTTWNYPVTPPSVSTNDKDEEKPKQRTQSSADAARSATSSVASPYKTSVFYDDDTFFNANDNDNAEMNKEIAEFLSLWEEKMKKWEAMGEWVEVRETLTGKVSWYNSKTTRLVFDTPPNVEILNTASIASLSPTINNNRYENEEKEYYLNRSLLPLPNENITNSLLRFDNNEWNFDYNNLNTYNYRLSASKRDHIAMLPQAQQYVFPEYFSLSPLSSLLANKFLAKIQLPSAFSKHKKYSLVHIKNDITKASDVIKAGVSKLDAPYNKTEDVSDFIIKIVGQEAYMYGKKHVIEYEAVRDALRNEDDVEFALIKRPDFAQLIENAKKEQLLYSNKFSTAYDNILLLCTPSKRVTLSDNKDNDDDDDDDDNNNNNNNDDDIISVDLPASSISLYEFEWHYRLKIEGLTNVTSLPRFESSIISIYVEAEIWCGDMLIKSATLRTINSTPKPNIRWGTWLSSQSQLFSQLPRESVLCLVVYGIKQQRGRKDTSTKRSIWSRSTGNKEIDDENTGFAPICLSWVRLPIIANDNKLRKGKYLLNMWHLNEYDNDKSFRFRGTNVDRNIKALDAEQCQLLIAFDEHPFDVIAPKYSTILNENRFSGTSNIHTIYNHHNQYDQQKQQKKEEINKKQKDLESIIYKSPLKRLEIFEKQLIWNYREQLWHRPEALSAFVRSVNWTNIVDIKEAHRYLDIWTAPKSYQDAIEYLDYKYMDTKLREKAVSWLNEMDDSDLQKYLLQLVQCLKFELYDENALSLFLIKRALSSPYQIGHYFFWHLKSEYDQYLQYKERFGLYLEEYLLFCCGHKTELFVQNAMLKRLEWISKKIISIPEKKRFQQDTKNIFKKLLYRLNHDLPSSKNIAFQIPLYPRWKALSLKIDSCKYMPSKKVPLWLVFENADKLGSDIVVMYKYGDDLRQDMLTLQIMTLMDNLWLNENLDLHLKPYRCLATGNQAGMIQIVLNSYTVNSISENYGGIMNDEAIDKFIKKYNTSKSFVEKAKQTFTRSVAGYCIATYVLGISDRHPSNYMVCKNGQFFHIDFGHFLGNWKTKWGIKRERTPLVFTNQMKYAISIDNDILYKQFLIHCKTAYNILRKKNRLLLILFMLMIAAGIPELVNENDIEYFQNKLNLNYDEKNASKHIEKAIDKALKDWGTYVNAKFHQFKQQMLLSNKSNK